MHVGIKGYDVVAATAPRANLVFLIDVSGSMDEPDKLPLLKSAFRLLVDKLKPEDTVSIVTYAGNAGTVLEPTAIKDKAKILAAIDTLQPGGSTAGAQGLEAAYDLAEQRLCQGWRQPDHAGDRRRLQCRPFQRRGTESDDRDRSARAASSSPSSALAAATTTTL